mgnify:CR=1 FL=1
MATPLFTEEARRVVRAIFEGQSEPETPGPDTITLTAPTAPLPDPEDTTKHCLNRMIEECFVRKSPYTGPGNINIFLSSTENPQDHGAVEERYPIPEEDLKIIEKIYHKKLPDCGRKRGALLRYISFFKGDITEHTNFFDTLKRQLERT